MDDFYKLLWFVLLLIFVIKYNFFLINCILVLFSAFFGAFMGCVFQGLIFGYSQSFVASATFWVILIIAGLGFFIDNYERDLR